MTSSIFLRSSQAGMQGLKLNYSRRRGYHFTLPAVDRPLAVEQKFIHIQARK